MSPVELMIPPNELNFVGGALFRELGQHCVDIFIKVGGLQPHHRVLDVGCGIGRIAIPLTQYLTAQGSYEGFDIVDVGIDWCQAHITSRYPNFRFQMADVFNRGYNPTGRYDACEYTFPYAPNSFDFVFTTSVFTHMLPRDFENYLVEIVRVLKPGGHCLNTYFLHNAEAARFIAEGKSQINWISKGTYWVRNLDVPEDAICFPESYVLEQHARAGLQINDPVYHGHWCGRPNLLTTHDVIVATKAPASDASRRANRPGKRLLNHVTSRLARSLLRRRWKAAVPDEVIRVRQFAASHPQLFQRPQQ